MKTSTLLSAVTVALLFAALSWAPTDTFTRTPTALAAAAPAHDALGRLGGSHRRFELASNGSATSNRCGPSPQSPRPVGQTNNKRKIVTPTTVPPCTPPPTKHG